MNEQLSTASARALATLDFRELSGLLWTARCKNGMDGSNSEVRTFTQFSRALFNWQCVGGEASFIKLVLLLLLRFGHSV